MKCYVFIYFSNMHDGVSKCKYTLDICKICENIIGKEVCFIKTQTEKLRLRKY